MSLVDNSSFKQSNRALLPSTFVLNVGENDFNVKNFIIAATLTCAACATAPVRLPSPPTPTAAPAVVTEEGDVPFAAPSVTPCTPRYFDDHLLAAIRLNLAVGEWEKAELDAVKGCVSKALFRDLAGWAIDLVYSYSGDKKGLDRDMVFWRACGIVNRYSIPNSEQRWGISCTSKYSTSVEEALP